MNRRWYVQVMGEVLGPLTDDELRELAAKGQITSFDQVRKGLTGDWVLARQVRGLFPQTTATAPVAVPPRIPVTHPTPVTTAGARAAPTPDSEEASKAQHSHLILCPDCGKRISQNARSCPNCGHAFFRPSRTIAVLLAMILGSFGAHKFYLRRPGQAVVYLLFFWTTIPGLVGLVEGFQYLFMDDERFTRLYGSSRGGAHVSQSRSLSNVVSETETPIRRWIVWGVVAFLMVITLQVAFRSDYRGSSSSSSGSSGYSTASSWSSGGTLHEGTALDWQSATYENKLATCADFLDTLWQAGSLKPSIQNSIHSVDDLRPYARELVVCIDAATRPLPNARENHRVFGRTRVKEIAVAGMMTMGWTK